MTFKIEGEHNTAVVHTRTDRSNAEREAVEQIQEMVDHEAFVGDDNVAIMPDFHWGAGAVIGFTMPVKDRVVPNTIGVDIGCGMFAVKLDVPQFDKDDEMLSQIDEEIRESVPMGFDVHSRNDYHMIEDFPYEACKEKLTTFEQNTDFDLPDPDSVYTDSYFEELCQQVGYDQTRAINSMGTLGGGNHFIELGTDSSGDVWCVIHSGSRGIGAEIAQYWQERATNKTTMRQSIEDVPESVREYMNDDWKPKADKIREDFDGEDIQSKFDGVSQAIQEYGPSTSDRNTDLDYLEGDEATGYIIDMIFAQTYASESRKQMARAVDEAVADVLGLDTENAKFLDQVESVHNYIDFEDATIRKGACRAHEGERLVVPFNMSYGTILARGRGQDDWNNSSAHGAGRAMSRTAARDQFDQQDFDEQISDVFMSKQPMDEIPGAYKSAGQVEEALGDSVEVIDHVEPFMSIKAE
jgi:tRNA-splicing ligase RtcB